eukprot:UN09603
MLQLQSPTVVYETVESTVGDIDFTLLNAILDFGFNLFTGIVNTVLAAGIAIPTVDRLVITDADITIQLRMMESPQVIATAGVLSAKLIVGYDIFTNDIRVATIKRYKLLAGASASIQGFRSE